MQNEIIKKYKYYCLQSSYLNFTQQWCIFVRTILQFKLTVFINIQIILLIYRLDILQFLIKLHPGMWKMTRAKYKMEQENLLNLDLCIVHIYFPTCTNILTQ